jgi:IS4 transposase
MRHHNSLMHDLLKMVPWSKYEASVEKHAADRGVRTLDSKSHLVALLHAQLSGAVSLREIETTMASQSARLYHLGVRAPKRSTLSDANAARPAALFADLFDNLLAQAQRGLRKTSKEAIRLIDATSISLSSLSKDWATYEAHGCAAKLHVVFDPRAEVAVHFAVTPARVNDITAAKAMPIEPGRTYVFDLGYYDFGWWADLISRGCRFVTRLKKNTPTRLVTERPVANGGNILADRVVRLPERLARSRKNPCACDLREVHVRIDTGKVLRIVSNDLDSTADEIAELYKTRWQIELFFRWVKQTLKIRKFLGTSENAIRSQIAVALIAHLLLSMAHALQSAVPSLLTFTRLVRANLMQFASIHQIAIQTRPRTPASTNQLELAIC